jgi:hypothetical protein
MRDLRFPLFPRHPPVFEVSSEGWGRKFSTAPFAHLLFGKLRSGAMDNFLSKKVISLLLLRHLPAFFGLPLLFQKRASSAKKP